MRRATQFAVVFVSLIVALGCGKSSDTETAQNTQTKKMPTQEPYETPEHLKRFGTGGTQLPETVLDTLRALKKHHEITRDEQWPGRGGVLANDLFEVWYPEGLTMITHAMRVVDDMMNARDKFAGVFGDAPAERLVIVLPPYLDQYSEWTGREYWHYSDLRADTMTIQPVYILRKRGLLEIAMPHEYFQWALGHFTNYWAPRWLEEGVASYFSDEGRILGENVNEFPKPARAISLDRLEKALDAESDKQETRIAYYLAHRMVEFLVERYGEAKLVETLSLMAQGHGLDDACQKAYGMSYEDVCDLAHSEAKQI
jgi:hypothetical protein